MIYARPCCVIQALLVLRACPYIFSSSVLFHSNLASRNRLEDDVLPMPQCLSTIRTISTVSPPTVSDLARSGRILMLYADGPKSPKMEDACTRQAQRTASLPSAYTLRTAQSRRARRHPRGPDDCATHDFSTPGCAMMRQFASVREGMWNNVARKDVGALSWM